MKKVLAISSVLLGVVFLAGCGQQPVSQTQPTTPTPMAQQPTQSVPVTSNIPVDWKSYSNNQYGFSVSYPSAWKLSELTLDNAMRQGVVFNEAKTDPVNSYAQLGIFYYPSISDLTYFGNDAPKSLDEIKTDTKDYKNVQNINFEGEQAYTAISKNNNTGKDKVVIFAPHNGHIYMITYSVVDKDIATINDVIKTFKFTDTQSDKAQSISTTETVSCGKKYLADITIIDNTDVVKRIIDLKTANGKCELNIASDSIGVSQKIDALKKVYTVVLYDKNDKQQSADPFNQSVEIFQIDLNNNTVSFQNQFDGSFTKIGNWK